ncbi:hypothetical protein L3Y34_003167 [Caenorhabditis briggsae]|uniref:DUF38 domain-containing protein n=1 Tax=Caenorhabditis briggsae TaxID=6238 RepID=A0AAE9AFB1_CAEBR|nr:hypothetical protein L3Y34_003167 [Caenorhabditis briggsae]
MTDSDDDIIMETKIPGTEITYKDFLTDQFEQRFSMERAHFLLAQAVEEKSDRKRPRTSEGEEVSPAKKRYYGDFVISESPSLSLEELKKRTPRRIKKSIIQEIEENYYFALYDPVEFIGFSEDPIPMKKVRNLYGQLAMKKLKEIEKDENGVVKDIKDCCDLMLYRRINDECWENVEWSYLKIKKLKLLVGWDYIEIRINDVHGTRMSIFYEDNQGKTLVKHPNGLDNYEGNFQDKAACDFHFLLVTSATMERVTLKIADEPKVRVKDLDVSIYNTLLGLMNAYCRSIKARKFSFMLTELGGEHRYLNQFVKKFDGVECIKLRRPKRAAKYFINDKEMVELKQWKQAKELDIGDRILHEWDSYVHFETVRVEWMNGIDMWDTLLALKSDQPLTIISKNEFHFGDMKDELTKNGIINLNANFPLEFERVSDDGRVYDVKLDSNRIQVTMRTRRIDRLIRNDF